MSEPTTKPLPKAVRQFMSTNGAKGGHAQNRDAKVKGGKAGAAARWANIPRCPCCLRPATAEQVAEVKKRLDAMGAKQV